MFTIFQDEPNSYYLLLITEITYLVLLAIVLYVCSIIKNVRVGSKITAVGFIGYSILMVITCISIIYYDVYREMNLLKHCIVVVIPAFGLVIAGNRMDRLRYLARAKNQQPFTRCKYAQPFLRNPYTDMSMIQVVVAILTWII